MSKFKTIAFPTGGVVPAEQARKKTEQRPGPHVPVDVAADYADYLTADRLAYEWTKENAPPPPTDTSAEALIVAARSEAQRIVDEATAKAGTEKARVIDQAKTDADEIRNAAKREAEDLVTEAKREAEEIRAGAVLDADQIRADGQTAADALVAAATAKAGADAGKSSGGAK